MAAESRMESVLTTITAAVAKNFDIWLFGQWVEDYATGQT
jgi:hypothetical protein